MHKLPNGQCMWYLADDRGFGKHKSSLPWRDTHFVAEQPKLKVEKPNDFNHRAKHGI